MARSVIITPAVSSSATARSNVSKQPGRQGVRLRYMCQYASNPGSSSTQTDVQYVASGCQRAWSSGRASGVGCSFQSGVMTYTSSPANSSSKTVLYRPSTVVYSSSECAYRLDPG